MACISITIARVGYGESRLVFNRLRAEDFRLSLGLCLPGMSRLEGRCYNAKMQRQMQTYPWRSEDRRYKGPEHGLLS